MSMKQTTIRMPEELHKQATMKTIELGISFQEYLIRLVQEDLKLSNNHITITGKTTLDELFKLIKK